MSDAEIAEARTVIAGLDAFSGLDHSALPIERQGGLTNLVYRVDTGADVLCLRLPGKGTEEYIDRAVEAHNARAAAAAGVSPDVLHADPETGVMVSRFIDGFETMSPARFCEKSDAPARAAQAFHKLHTSGETFEFRFELFAMIDEYLKVLSRKTVDFPEGYYDVLEEANGVREALETHRIDLAPCHCDPLCENFLDDGNRMWIIDWEYSGMNDPLWDLGDFSVEAGFSAHHDREMLEAYFGRAPTAFEEGCMVLYKAMCDLLWTLWGLIQHANGNPVDDFWAYSVNRFERCRKLMKDPAFEDHLAAVRAGP
jgi:thiamine kinase-like enzyme